MSELKRVPSAKQVPHLHWLLMYYVLEVDLDYPILEALSAATYVQRVLALHASDPKSFPWDHYQDPDVLMELVQRDQYALGHVKHQTPELCAAAIRYHGGSLFYVRDQHMLPEYEALCLSAVRQNGRYMALVYYETEAISLAAMQQDGLALEYVEHQTDAICMAAVTQNGRALRYVLHQTEAICLAAVTQYGRALGYAHHRTGAVCRAAVAQDPSAIVFVPDGMEDALGTTHQ